MESIYIPGVNGSSAIGNHGLKSVQKAPATAKMRLFLVQSGYRNRENEIVHCAKGLASAKMSLLLAQSGYRNRENEIVHCAKGLATAKMSLLLAQSGYRNRDNEIVPCANCHRICRNEIVPPTMVLRQSR